MRELHPFEPGFPLRSAVRFIILLTWMLLFFFLIFPLSYVVSLGLFFIISIFDSSVEETPALARILVIISLSITAVVPVSSMVLLTMATKEIPQNVSLFRKRQSYKKWSFKSWFSNPLKKKMLTIMLIPHSEHRIVQFQASSFVISIATIIFVVMVIGLTSAVIYYPIRRASLRSNLSSIEKNIEKTKQNLLQLEREKEEIEKIISSDREIINFFYSSQIRPIKRLVLENNFITGFIAGLLSSLATAIISFFFTSIFAGIRNKKKQGNEENTSENSGANKSLE